MLRLLRSRVGHLSAPVGTVTAVSPDAAVSKRIEDCAKINGELVARMGALDGQMMALTFSEFTVIGAGLAIVGFYESQAPKERIAVTVAHSLHVDLFLYAFFVGLCVAAVMATPVLFFALWELLKRDRPLLMNDRAGIRDTGGNRMLSLDEFHARYAAEDETARLLGLRTTQYEYRRALAAKLQLRLWAFRFLGAQVFWLLFGAYGVAGILLSGH